MFNKFSAFEAPGINAIAPLDLAAKFEADIAAGAAARLERQPLRLSDLLIQTKDQRLVPFTPNHLQEAYLDTLVPNWREGDIQTSALREIILKARQFGFSTLIAALFFLSTVTTQNTTTVVVAHDNETSEEIFQMIHRFWENLPDHNRPATRYNSRRQLFWPSLNSRFLARTAGSRAGAGRGLTIQNLHCSEAAFYTNPRLFTALLQAVPANGCVFVESTANGESGDGKVFHDEYQKARLGQGQGQSAFTARFYAWWQHEEYEREPGPDWQRTPEEWTLVRKHDLDTRFGAARTDRKLAWRRWKRSEPGMGSLSAQEFPGDDREAFLVSGTRFFPDWNESRHVVYPDEVTLERYWPHLGGYDWGYGAPACFLLACVDDRQRVIVLDEVYQDHKTDPEQASAVVECLKRHRLEPSQVLIYADPSMWAAKTDWSGKRVQNVAAFVAAGLRMTKATNDRLHGWQNVRRYLHDGDEKDGVPYLRVLRGRCPNLIRTMPLMLHDTHSVEDADTRVEDHACDTLRYLLAARLRPTVPPELRDPAAAPPGGERDYRPAWLRKPKKRRVL